MSLILENRSSEGDIFQNHSNPSYQVDMTGIHDDDDLTLTSEEHVEVSKQSIIVQEIRILIDDEVIARPDFTATLPAANKIVISYSSREFSTRFMEITLGITGQAAVSLMAYAATTAITSSSKSLRGLNFVVAANAVGFIATFLGILFSKKSKQQISRCGENRRRCSCLRNNCSNGNVPSSQ